MTFSAFNQKTPFAGAWASCVGRDVRIELGALPASSALVRFKIYNYYN